MNELLQQFLIESRELAVEATAGLLALERAPRDAQQLDAVFRALHTLKGGAGIVEFTAMERAVHAAEDVLAAARAGRRVLTPAIVSDCLACLDQVLQWLDTIERIGELPSGDCEREADRVVARFSVGRDTGPAPAMQTAGAWLPPLLARHPAASARALTAIRYTPDPDCFFRGEDPLARLIAAPGLLAFEAGHAAPWPPLATFDAFRCNLTLAALVQSTPAQVAAHLQQCTGELEVLAIDTNHGGVAAGALPAPAQSVLGAQRALIDTELGARSHGHLASAARTAANVLRSCGRGVEADQLTELAAVHRTAEALLAPLRAALERVLKQGSAVPAASAPESAAARTLRVDAERIDALVRLTGELTVARNALAHLAMLAASEANPLAPALKARHAAFEHLIGELQRSVLALRVLPLRTVFQRFPRLLREMSASLGKPVELRIDGEDTEADKVIVEMLFEPLLHVVRNALDHGVESATLRAERGKPRVATIQLRAARQGDQVMVEVTDDGGGMDIARIREVATQRGIVTAQALRDMPDAEVIDLVFAPGFSTAHEVTALSGRGVGMDAARIAVERVGGRVSIQSDAGKGTTVRFMLPFSVMMTTVISMEAGGQMFGVPLDTVVETLRVPRSALSAVGNARAIVLRDQTIPVFELAGMLGEAGRASDGGEATMIVVSFAGQRCGLDVDALGERIDIILKPLDGLLAGTPGIAGTTLLGDGRVLLVLDVAELLA